VPAASLKKGAQDDCLLFTSPIIPLPARRGRWKRM